ncbi:uncharacterized protein PAC_11017 [Phialocephala subalpina]|uniref:Uncharacterized protein n=1 Tax=Phialocephala subalpina TaxID=576137 RepID=A0A1L7X7X5_9HELO|nr:uncharacterized protein PAC_11017 [Phialocephala subalpina]
MMSYRDHRRDDYEEEDELDIRVRRGRASPQPVVYPEHRYRPAPRPYYDQGTSYLVPGVSGVTTVRRSRSTSRRRPITPPSPQPAPAPPVIINNRIYNDYEDDDYLPLAPRHHERRERSRSRASSFVSPRDSRDEWEIERLRREVDEVKYDRKRDDYEIEKARRELEAYRIAHSRDEYEQEKTRRELEKYRAALSRDDYEQDRIRRELEAYRVAHTRDEYEVEKAKREVELYRLEKERLDEEKRIKKQISQTKEDMELEATKKELQAYKAAKKREEEEARIKKEMEMKRIMEEKKAADEKARLKKESEAAIEKYKIEMAEKAAKEKKEKEEREKEYQKRMEEDLRKSGMDERQIAVVLKKDKGVDPARPTYTRMSRRHLSIETLNRYRIDYEFDQVRKVSNNFRSRANTHIQDPDYILIKRWVPEYEQDFLWSHTREIRERRRAEPVLLLEERKSSKSRHKHHDDELQLVIEKKHKHERKPSPSPILQWVAGSRR